MADCYFSRFLLWLLCISGISDLSAQAQIKQAVVLTDTLAPTNISSSVAVFVDPTRQLTVDQARLKQYTQSGNDGLNFHFSPAAVWLRFTLQQPANTPRDYVLQLTNWYIDEADMYSPRPDGRYQIERVGDLTPLRLRSIKSRYPTVGLHLADSRPQTFYLRVSSTQYNTFSVQVWPRSLFFEARLLTDSADFSLGLITMRFAFHLALLLFMFYDRRFRAYSLFGISICLIYFFSGGNGTMLFPNSPYLANVLFFVTLSFIPASLSYLVAEVMEIPARLPRMVPVFYGFGLIGVLNLVANLFGHHAYLSWAFIAFMSLMLLVLLISMVWAWGKGARPSVWYTLPLLIYIPPFCLFYARNAGLHSMPMTEVGMRVIFFIEFLCVPFIMAAVLRSAYRERLFSMRDLAQRTAEQTNLIALDALKTRFFVNISHEFRTPLTLLIGPLTDLRQRFPADDIYQIMYRNASRLQLLINQLLDLAKLDNKQLLPSLRPGPLSTDLRLWVAGFEQLAHNQNIKLTINGLDTIQHALYDADKLEKIVTNLVANAIRFTESGGYVTVDVHIAQAEATGPASQFTTLTLAITDSGTGIAPEHLPFIFDRFYQVDASQRRGFEGTGVGLALVYELVQNLDGHIAATSEPGHGTTMTVRLPLQVVSAPTLPIQYDQPLSDELPTLVAAMSARRLPLSTPVKITQTDQRPIILIVEDNDDLRTYIRSVLGTLYQIREAANGQQGLAIAYQEMPDLIVTDLMMPVLNGLDLCRQLRSADQTSHVPLVMLTAKATLDDRLTGLETGADDYLTKPFNAAELLTRVRNLLDRQRALRNYMHRQLTNQTTPADAQENRPNKQEAAFLARLAELIDVRLSDSEFDVEKLANLVSMSSRTLNRKLNAIAGLSAGELIRSQRLQHAAQLLTSGVSSTETAYRVGFDNSSYFSRVFREHYGQTPTDFVNGRSMTENQPDLSEK